MNLARELKKKNLKKQLNIKVTVVPIVTGALGTIPKRLVKGIEDFMVIIFRSTDLKWK